MRIKDLLVGKSALSTFNQSMGVEPLAAQTKCTLSPFNLLIEDNGIKQELRKPGAKGL